MSAENLGDRINQIFNELGLEKAQNMAGQPTLGNFFPYFVGADALVVAKALDPETPINEKTRLTDVGGVLGGVILGSRANGEVAVSDSGTTSTIDSGLGKITGPTIEPVWSRTPQAVRADLKSIGARSYKVEGPNLTSSYRDYVVGGANWIGVQKAGFTENTSNPIGQAVEDIRSFDLAATKNNAREGLNTLKNKIGGFFRRGSERLMGKIRSDAFDMALIIRTLDPSRPGFQPVSYTLRAI